MYSVVKKLGGIVSNIKWELLKELPFTDPHADRIKITSDGVRNVYTKTFDYYRVEIGSEGVQFSYEPVVYGDTIKLYKDVASFGARNGRAIGPGPHTDTEYTYHIEPGEGYDKEKLGEEKWSVSVKIRDNCFVHESSMLRLGEGSRPEQINHSAILWQALAGTILPPEP